MCTIQYSKALPSDRIQYSIERKCGDCCIF